MAPVSASGGIPINIMRMIPMRVAQSNEYHGPRSTEQTMFIRCAVGHIPSILRIGEMTTPMATIMASMTILNVLDLSVFIMNLLEMKIWSAEADIIGCAGNR